MRPSLLEGLEPRMLLAGDHASFSEFPNVNSGDVVSFDAITFRGSLDGVIEPLGPGISELNDLFKFTAIGDDFVTVKADATNTLAGSTLNTKIRIYTANAQGQPVLVGQSSGDGVLTAGTPTDAWFGFIATAGTAYYVVVEGDVTTGPNSTGAYTLRVAGRSEPIPVLPASGEASAGGTITIPGEDIVYNVRSGSSSFYDSLASFNATATSNDITSRLDTRIEIYDASGTLIASDSQSGRRNDAFLTLKSVPDKLYYVRVRSDEFLVSRSAFATGDFFIAIDLAANNFPTLIDPVIRRVSDTLGALNETDGFQTRMYKFIAQGTGQMIITAIPRFALPPRPLLNPALRVFDAAGVQLALNDDLIGVIPQIELAVVGGRQYEIIIDNFIGNPNQSDYSLFVEANHTFDDSQPVDDHPTTPDPANGTVKVTREFRDATPLVWGAPYLITDAASLPIQDRGWITDAWGTGRVYKPGDTDLFQFTPQVDMLGGYEGSNDDNGTALYVGGQFLHAGTITSSIESTNNFIAAYDANDWWNARRGLKGPLIDPLDPSKGRLPGTVRAMVQYDDDGDGVPSLFVGGDFVLASNTANPAQDIVVNGLAKWTFVPQAGDYLWRAVGLGVTKTGGGASVRALAVWDPDAYGTSLDLPPTLIVGGSFTSAVNANGVPVANTTNLAMYIGGAFAAFEGAATRTAVATGSLPVVNAIVQYIQDPPDPDGPGPLDDPEPLSYLAIGGSFTNGVVEYGPNRPTAPGGAQNREHRTLVGGVSGGPVNALLGFDPPPQVWTFNGVPVTQDLAGVLIVGGGFTTRGTRIAQWDGTTVGTTGWKVLGTGMNNSVNALVAYDADDPDGAGPAPNPPNVIVAGGAFTTAGGVTVGRVAQFTYTPAPGAGAPAPAGGWSPLGPGSAFTDPDPLKAPVVNALAVMSDEDVGVPTGPVLYAGGAFTRADGAAANRVAKLLWNGLFYQWRQMGPGGAGPLSTSQPFLTDNGVSDTVFAMAEFDDGNPNFWDRHDRPSSRLNVVITPDFEGLINTFVRVFDSSMNLVAQGGLYQNGNIDGQPWSSQLPDASTFPLPPDIGRSGMIDPSLALPGGQLDGIIDLEGVFWAGETYYLEVSTDLSWPMGRYTVRVTADAYVPDGPNSQFVDPTADGTFATAFQFAQPVGSGDARNFIFDPVNHLTMSRRRFRPTGSAVSIDDESQLGNIYSVDETDFYSFRAQSGGMAEVRINTTQLGDNFREYFGTTLAVEKNKTYDSFLDSTLRVYKADFEQIAYNDEDPTVTGEPSILTSVGTFGTRVFHKRDARVVFPIIAGEVYYIAVGSGQRWQDGSIKNPALRAHKKAEEGEIDWRHATGSYEILVNSMSNLNQSVDDHQYNGGYDLATPIFIAADPAVPATNGRGSINGILNSSQDADGFFFLAPARGVATLKIARQAGSTAVPIVNVVDAQLQLVKAGTANSNGDLTLTFPVTPGERFNIVVFGSTGGYTLSLSGMPYADDFVDSRDLTHPTAVPQLDFQGNGTVQGSIEQPGDTDIFKFSTNDFAVMTITVSTTAGTFNPFVTVFEVTLDAGGLSARDPVYHPVLARIAYNDDISGTNRNARVSFPVTPNRTTQLIQPPQPNTFNWYYVVVSGSDPSTDYGAYTLRLDFPPTDDHPDAGEYPFAHSIVLDSATGAGSTTGVTEILSDSDLFRFVAPAGGEAGVVVTRPSGSTIVPKVTVIELVNGNPVVLATGTATDSSSGFEPADSGLFQVVRGNTYYVLVENTGSTFGAYTVSVTAPAVDDYPNIGEFGIAEPIVLSPATGDGFIGGDSAGDSNNPHLSPVNDTDLFKFVPFENGRTTVRLTSYSGAVGRFAPRIRVYDSSQNLIADNSNPTMPTTGTPSVVVIGDDGSLVLTGGQTYYVLVSAVTGLPPPATLTGEYKIFVDTFVSDGGGGGDPGFIDFDNPTVLGLNARTGAASRSDLIDVAGDRDLFTFTLPDDANGPAFVQVVTPLGSVLDVAVTILDAPNESAVVTSDSVGIPGVNANAAFTGVGGRQYWAIVAGIGSGVGAYTLRVKTQPAVEFLYFPEGFASAAIREFVSISNNNTYPVNVTIWAYYEDTDLSGPETAPAPTRLTSIFSGGELTLAPGARSGITTSNAGSDFDADPGNDSEGKRAGLIFDRPYALVIESSGPVGATIAHYDFGATIGDSFTDRTSATWTFARVEKNPGAVEDFLLYYNPNPYKVRVSATAYTAAGQAIALPDRDLGANERAGLAIDQIPNIPTGIVSVTVRAIVHPDEGTQSVFLGVVASLSHYDKANQRGYGYIGDGGGGSRAGAITSLTNGDTVGGELALFNPGDTAAVVNLVGSYVIADLPNLVRIINVPAHSVRVLAGNDLEIVRNQPIGLHWNSNVPVTLQSSQNQNGEADATGAAVDAGQAFFFGDGFMNTVYAGQLYFETLAFYNPTAVDTVVQVKLLFTGVNDFIIANVDVRAHKFAQLKLHELQSLVGPGRPVLNFYSIQANAPVPFVATLTHYDLYLRGGFTTAGAPLGLLNDLSSIPT